MSGPGGTSRKRGNWSAQDLERLKILYPRCPEDRVAELLKRSVDSVRRRAKDVFGGQPQRRGPWSDEEIEGLRLGYGVQPIESLALVLARSEREVRAKARELRAERRRGPWTAAEVRLLKKLYGSRTDADLEVSLSRGRRQIRQKATELCLHKDKRFASRNGDGKARMPRWTPAEEARLVSLYPDHDNLDVARALGRTVASVANKASNLGLRKSEAQLRTMGQRNVSNRYGR